MSMPVKNRPKISLIVLNWNNGEETIRCLESLAKITYPARVILVDNGSEHAHFMALKLYKDSHPARNITLLENKQNKGFAGGNNAGIRHALKQKTDYILILNNDTRVAPDFLDALVQAAEQNPSCGIIGPCIYYLDGPDMLWFSGGRINWLNISGVGEHEHGYGAKPEKQKPEACFATGFVTGCALMARAEVFRKIGDFDERFFLYFEDVDFNLRAKKAGWQSMVASGAKIWHKVSATSIPKLGGPRILYYHHRNGMLLAEKHAPLWVNIYKHFWAAAKLAKQCIKLMFGKDREAASAIIQGIFDYYGRKFGIYDSNRR